MLDRFALRLTVRLLFLTLTVLAAMAAVVDGRFLVSATVALGVGALQIVWLRADVRKTNLELARFLETARAGDFTQSFERPGEGAGFVELGRSLSGLMEKFRRERADVETEGRYLRAVLDQVPVPLIAVFDDGALERLNNASRRLFDRRPIRRVEELEPFGEELAAALAITEPGTRTVVRFGDGDRVVVSVSRIQASGRSLRLCSLQSLRDELEGAQLEAWQQLVRVLTHELMNSLTPIRSLAETAAELLEREEGSEARVDAKEAVETVAKRADGLLVFVDSYRQISRLPQPEREPVSVGALFADVLKLFELELARREVRIETRIEPANLEIEVDCRQIEQVLINLIRNALDAKEHRLTLSLHARISRDGRAELTVADDGPGLPPDVASRAFVPFFTTKRGGTGVGLALTRQIMRAHGGFVSLRTAPGSGARFVLTF